MQGVVGQAHRGNSWMGWTEAAEGGGLGSASSSVSCSSIRLLGSV